MVGDDDEDIGTPSLFRPAVAAWKLPPVSARGVGKDIGQAAGRGENHRGIGLAFRADIDAGNGGDKCDAFGAPMFAFLQQVFLLEIDRVADGNHRVAGGVQKRDGQQLAGADQFVRALVDQFVEHRFQTVLQDGVAETHGPNHGAQGVGDFLGAIPQIGPGGVPDAHVLLDLPADHQQPDSQQKSVNQQAAGRLHDFAFS